MLTILVRLLLTSLCLRARTPSAAERLQDGRRNVE